MSDFKVKSASNSISAGAPPQPLWGAYIAPPGSLAGIKGPNSKGREIRKWERGEGREAMGSEGRVKTCCPI